MTAHILPFTDLISAETNQPKVMVRGEGPYVFDAEGKKYLDAVSGLWCASLGFNPERLQRAAADQLGKLAYYHSFMGRTCAPASDLAERLVEKLPGDLRHVFFGTSGSEAVETAIKFACYFQIARGKAGKTKILARKGAYHGSGHISAALTGMGYCHEGFHLPLSDVIRIGRPHYLTEHEPGESEADFVRRLGRELQAVIDAHGAGTIAAMIAEPVMGSGGVILPPEGYWQCVQEILAENDILLIADEIITGFGRTGSWFACETYGIAPDLLTAAKQMTGAVFPMSAVAMTNEVRNVIAERSHALGTFGHGVTFGAHPVGAAIALEALRIYDEMDLPSHVARLGRSLFSRLTTLQSYDIVQEVRSVGLVGAIEFHHADHAAAVARDMEHHGVLLRVIGNILAVCPPYIVSETDLLSISETAERAIRNVGEKRKISGC
ncbi:aminotransferase class III-fold pyridoxal phosphate-dependent enzyme [Pacificispira sp.]|uniref:aminotransferase class III-fold pyridoxal phosphate-dependent enzyme n=1 Tax=Pacificispira sp. TaxID=2888761 RepID=UPI003B52E8E6